MIYSENGVVLHDTGTRDEEQKNPMHLIFVAGDDTEYIVAIQLPLLFEPGDND
jgi:hypothetical protein